MKYITMQERNLIMIGFGSIGPAVLPLLLRHLEINPRHIFVIAADEKNRKIAEDYGVNFSLIELSAENYEAYLLPLLKADDVLVNLSVGVSCLDVIALCQREQVLYLDTSTETWTKDTLAAESTTFERRSAIMDYAKQHPHSKTTALICHGANPGLVSHFVKQALLDIYLSQEKSMPDLTVDNAWGKLGKFLNVVSLHISEKDTQQSHIQCQQNEYANTWSVEGFLSEASEYAGFAWGSHERDLPQQQIKLRIDTEKCRVIELAHPGCAVKIHSWAPNVGAFEGYVIPHPEAFSIAELLNVYDANGYVTYQPTIHFSYLPCEDAQQSMQTAAKNGWQRFVNNRLLFDETVKGVDALGVLVLRKNSSDVYWYGSQLSVDDARKLAPHNNATSLQVAAGVLAGVVWMIENPNEGVVEAEQMDFERVLEIAAPYLGNFGGTWGTWSGPSNEKNQDWHFAELMIPAFLESA
jgi:homospermidine synthase